MSHDGQLTQSANRVAADALADLLTTVVELRAIDKRGRVAQEWQVTAERNGPGAVRMDPEEVTFRAGRWGFGHFELLDADGRKLWFASTEQYIPHGGEVNLELPREITVYS